MKNSYTMQLIDTMMNAMIQDKKDKGFNRLSNGLFEDCLGQVYTVELIQKSETYEDGVLGTVSLVMKPVSVMGRL